MSGSLRAALAGDVFELAESLLGMVVQTEFDDELTAVRITEVEVYAGATDPASHAYRGRTKRNASMFEAPGTLYVYLSYGIHWCMNVVAGPAGSAHAVLLRGGDVVAGREVVVRRRGRDRDLTNGPGKLCQALGVTGDHDGSSLLDGPVRITGGSAGGTIVTTPRVGISKAVDRPWRYLLTG